MHHNVDVDWKYVYAKYIDSKLWLIKRLEAAQSRAPLKLWSTKSTIKFAAI